MLRIYTVDAFASVAFEGNPAGVCIIDNEKLPFDDTKLQKIASEVNLSETAFISQVTDGGDFKVGDEFNLRWFTPTNEVPLCGHGTLGAAAALFYCIGNNSSSLKFHTLSGTLLARRCNDEIVLDFPLNEPTPMTEDDKDLMSLVQPVVGDLSVHEVQLSGSTVKKLLIRLNDKVTRSDLEKLSPDPRELLSLHDGSKIKSIIVTVAGNEATDDTREKYDFLSRNFAPWHGIPEDPVTGSAHTVLGPYWSEKLGKKELYARQCSKRGGNIRVKLRDDSRVDLSGKAVIVMEGSLRV
ncbi:phenazine biosynthesis-like domain-containing protein [Tubulanus polymorphus]|uniref:phenazine biosynthesis-like domain-containing protein n=1 Tax=Tubulanus polymorphus TaxID=672921 RepID=UPI003DA62FC0